MAAPNPPTDDPVLTERIKRAEASVEYDVSLGLERHRRLVASGSPLPDWAREVPDEALRASRWSRARWLIGLSGALLLLGAGMWSWGDEPSPSPSRTNDEAAQATATAGSAAPMARPSAPTTPFAPAGEAAASGGPDGLAARPRATPPSRNPSTLEVTPLVEPLDQAPPPTLARGDSPPPERSSAPSGDALGPAPAEPPASSARRARSHSHAAAGPDAHAASPAEPNGAVGKRSTGTSVTAQDPLDEEEIRQLARARKQLPVDPVGALRQVRESEAQFPQGYLQQERRYIELRALFALHRTLEARTKAGWFLKDYPNSPYVREIERALLRSDDP